MKIELKLYASLSRHMPTLTIEGGPPGIEVREGSTVRGILEELGIPAGTVKLIFLNGVHAGMEDVLKDGDRLGVFPPVAGG